MYVITTSTGTRYWGAEKTGYWVEDINKAAVFATKTEASRYAYEEVLPISVRIIRVEGDDLTINFILQTLD